MGKKILVVDDERDIIDTVREILEPRGYKVITASNGDECLEAVRF